MSLVLNGTTQSARFDATAPPVQGEPNFCPMANLGHPLWMLVDFKIAATPGTWTLFAITDPSSGIRFYWVLLAGLTVRLSNAYIGNVDGPAITLNAWHRALMCLDGRGQHSLLVDGVASPTNVVDAAWPLGISNLSVGAIAYSGTSGAPGFLFNGKLANFAMGTAPPTAEQRAAAVPGQHPLSINGCCRWNPLLGLNADDYFGVWPLTLIGAPTFDSGDHPELDLWPPPGAPLTGVYPGSSPKMRSAGE